MSFKGDLSTIGLAEVFQMISMSQKEGTLNVQDSESRKAIYFGSTGVKLVSTGKRKGMRIGDILVRAGRISEENLQEALENSKIQKRMLGEVLVESGFVTDAEIQQIVREQIEEEIYDLFLWKRANFEFVEGPSSEALKDLDAPVTKLTFDVNGLLLEAVRRADEWVLINQKLPSFDSIFVWISPQARVEEDDSSADSSKRVYRFIDGETSVSEIVEFTGAPKFEACKILLDLAGRERIRLLEVPEMLVVAQKRISEGRRDKGVKFYLAAGAQAPLDAKVAGTLARVLENEGLARESAQQYARAGRLFLEQGDLDRAFDNMRRANELAPEDPDIRMGMFEVHAVAGNLGEGKRMAQELATQALMSGDPTRALVLCDRILKADPEDLDFRILRAKSLHRLNQKKDLDEEITFIRKKMPVDQKRAGEINQALKEVMARTPTTKTPTSTVKAPPPPKKKRTGIKVAAGIVLLGGLGFCGKYELDARSALNAAVARATELMGTQSFQEARRSVDGFLSGTHRFSLTQKKKAEAFLREVEERTSVWEREKSDRETRDREAKLERMESLEAAVTEERNVNPEAALEKALEMRRVAETTKDAAHRMKRAKDLISALEKYLGEALQLKVQADELEKSGKFPEAALMIDRLMREYRITRLAAGAFYPLEITTRPAGVKVTTRGGLVLGDTGAGPVRHRMKDGEVVRLLFEKQGYASMEVPVKDKTQGRLRVELIDKRESWAMPLGFSVSGEPAMGEDMLFVAGGSRLYALRLSTQRLLWTEMLGDPIEGSPRAANGLVYAAAGRSVTAFDPKQADKRVAWKYALPERATCGPGLSPDGALLFIASADRTLSAINARTGELVWKKAVPAAVAAEPTVAGGVLGVACEDGTLIGIQPGAPEELWRVKGDAGYGSPGVSGPYLYLTGADQTVHAIDMRSGKRAWRQDLPTALTGRPVRLGDVVYVSGKNGRIHFLDATTGEPGGTYETGGPILGGVASSGALLLFGSDDQSLHAFDPAIGGAVWKWKSKGRLRNPVVVAEGKVYFCGDDTLYAIELN